MLNLVNSVSLFMEILLVVFGIPGNLLIIVVSYLHARRSTTDILIGFQAVIDLLAAVPAIFSIILVTGPNHVNYTFCKFRAFSLRYVRYTSLFLMAAIALDRFRVVCRPLDHRWSWSSRHIMILVLFCNLLSIAISFPQSLVTVPLKLATGVRCARSASQLPLFDHIYPVVTTLLFFVALLITSALYLKVFQVIRKQNRIRAAMTAPPPSGTTQSTAAAVGASEISASSQATPGISTVFGGNAMQEIREVNPQRPTHKRRPLLLVRCAWHVTHDERQEQCVVEMNGIAPVNQSLTEDDSSNERQQQELLQQKQSNSLLTPSPAFREPDSDQPQMFRPTSPECNQENGRQQNKKKKMMQPTARKERQTTSMLLVVTIIFFVSWFPGIITTHIPSEALRAFRRNVFNDLVVVVGYALRNINHIVNVFIYTLMSRRFKQQCTQVIRRLLRRRQQ